MNWMHAYGLGVALLGLALGVIADVDLIMIGGAFGAGFHLRALIGSRR